VPKLDDASSKSEKRIRAVAVSRGIGIGHVVEFRDDERRVVRHTIGPQQVEFELDRFHRAVDQCRRQIEALIDGQESRASAEVTDIFRVHNAILLDPDFLSRIEHSIEYGFCNSEWAVHEAATAIAERQAATDEPSFREKRLDVEDVCDRLISILEGTSLADKRVFEGAVILARELRPSTILELQRNRPAALVTERGGWTSHSSIVAREFRIPMVSGVRASQGEVRAGQHAIVDGDSGVAILHPSRETVEAFAKRIDNLSASGPADHQPKQGSTMLDGTRIVLRANADIPESYASARKLGAEGVGLFRSESLIGRAGRVPSEIEQVAAYVEMANAAGEFGVKIRTFDIGVERYFRNGDGTVEQNPALGLRAIRLCLREDDLFRRQIRALLRAASVGRLDVLLPMVSGPAEVLKAAEIIAEERERLAEEGTPFGSPGLGAMIEVPSAVLTAPEIARKVDFLSLGTNDLVQYLLAVDRDNYAVADWYETLHPAVLRAIRSVIENAADAGVPLTVCGEMAASPFYLPVLIGLGVRELSLNVNAFSPVRNLLAGITLERCVDIVTAIEGSETASETEEYLKSYYRENWANLIPQNLLLR
jgi:phosphotransferase system enzyme I (PtsI)